MDPREYKSVQKRIQKNQATPNKMKKYMMRLFNQVLLTVILFLGTLIAMKCNTQWKSVVYQNVYQTNLNFTKANEWYQKYFGSIFPLRGVTGSEQPVFQEKLTYQEANLYKDGAVLSVSKNYMVPFLESGIVVFMGEKEGYGFTVIVQQVNGIDVWYGNVESKEIKMYDYVEKGSLLGETKNDKLYLAFQKEGKFVNYQEYIS